MIDHVYISVTNIDKSLAFYCAALKPLGWSAFGNYKSASGPEGIPDLFGIGDDAFGGGKAVGSSIWLRQRKPGETGLYIGIVCHTNELVDAAYAAAIKAGVLAGLMRGGLAVAMPESVKAGGRSFVLVRLVITDAGRAALAE